MDKFLQQIKLATHLTKPLKLALVVRGDLKLSKGKTAAQCSHASVMCYQEAMSKKPELLKAWLASGQPKIVLRCSDMNELTQIYQKCKELGIGGQLIHDAGRTQVAAGTATVLGIGPNYESVIDDVVKHLKLL